MFTPFASQQPHAPQSPLSLGACSPCGRLPQNLVGVLVGVMVGLATSISMGPVPAVAQAAGPFSSTEAQSGLLAAAPAAPQALTNALAAMDAAANQQQLGRLMRFYRSDFTHGDGLNRSTLKQAVKAFWQQYQQLNYKTELLEWQAEANGDYMATTTTTITGRRPMGNQVMQLSATIKSRQRWNDGKVVNQTILAEHSQLTGGTNAPQVTVYLPEQVKVGETYSFDVIIDEPLGERVLLGTALAESVSAEGYLQQPRLDLEPLPTGGLFKVGKAPKQPGHEWVSAVLAQEGGMTMIHRRLIVLD